MAEIIYEMSDEEYFSIDALNASTLKNMVNPQKAKYTMDNPKTSTAMVFGTQFHDFVLRGIKPELTLCNPKNIVSQYDEFRTKEAKQWRVDQESKGMKVWKLKDVYEADHGTVHLIKQMEAMSAEINRLEGFKEELASSKTEVVILWDRNGLPCKAKLDMYNPESNYVWDLKTCGNLDKFDADVINYGYYISAAWYIEAARQIDGKTRGAMFAVAGKDEPYQAMLKEVPDVLVDVAEGKIDELIDVYKACKSSGEWPSPYTTSAMMIDVPGWFLRQNGFDDIIL